MRQFALALVLAALPGLGMAGGEEIWSWTDSSGTVHFTNRSQFAPEDAKLVDSRVTMEVDRIPVEGEEPSTASNFDAYDPFPRHPELRYPKIDRRWRWPITEPDAYHPLPYDGGNEQTRMPHRGPVYDSFGEHLTRSPYPGAVRFEPLPDAPRVYDKARLEFGCYTAGVLWAGGFSHANDISGVPNCYPYRLGPRAWLNAAQAELAMRENGINPRDMMQLYMEEYGPAR